MDWWVTHYGSRVSAKMGDREPTAAAGSPTTAPIANGCPTVASGLGPRDPTTGTTAMVGSAGHGLVASPEAPRDFSTTSPPLDQGHLLCW